MAALRDMAGGRVGVRWVCVDEVSGQAVAVTGTSYVAPPLLRALIEVRDRSCRFPGCMRAAERCDCDHIDPYPRGDTSDRNTCCLCRRHHRLKTHAHWRVVHGRRGELIWTSPRGKAYVSRPGTWAEPGRALSVAADPSP
jgi:hypothetical protein